MADNPIIYHEKAVRYNAMMQTDTFKEMEAEFAKRKQGCLGRIAQNESGVSVSHVEETPDGKIKVIVINSDELRHELAFWQRLEGQFAAWKKEAGKRVDAAGIPIEEGE